MKIYLRQKPPIPEEQRPANIRSLLRFALSEENTCKAADALLSQTGSPLEILSLPPKELKQCSGMNDSGAVLIRATAAVARRYWMQKYEKALSFDAPHSIIDYLCALYLDTNVEEIYLLCFDGQKRFLSCDQLSSGGFKSSSVDHRRLLQLALEHNAASVILSHNHPAGEPDGSRADYEANQKIKELLASVHIDFYDHIVISRTEYASLLGHSYENLETLEKPPETP